MRFRTSEPARPPPPLPSAVLAAALESGARDDCVTILLTGRCAFHPIAAQPFILGPGSGEEGGGSCQAESGVAHCYARIPFPPPGRRSKSVRIQFPLVCSFRVLLIFISSFFEGCRAMQLRGADPSPPSILRPPPSPPPGRRAQGFTDRITHITTGVGLRFREFRPRALPKAPGTPGGGG